MHLTILMIPLFSICPGSVSCFNDWFFFFLFWLLFVCLIPLHLAELVTKRVRLQPEVPVYSALPPTEVFFSFLYNLVCLLSCLYNHCPQLKTSALCLTYHPSTPLKGLKYFLNSSVNLVVLVYFFSLYETFASGIKSHFLPLWKGFALPML